MLIVFLILSNVPGDQVSKKGGMTGGYYDFRRSKLKFVNIIRQNKLSIHAKTAELDEIERKLKDILKEVTRFVFLFLVYLCGAGESSPVLVSKYCLCRKGLQESRDSPFFLNCFCSSATNVFKPECVQLKDMLICSLYMCFSMKHTRWM